MSTLLLKPQTDDREDLERITSRIGLSAHARCFSEHDNLYTLAKKKNESEGLNCVLVDEGQFLSSAQVYQLSEVVDLMQIPVLVYGIRTDFRGHLFEGSRRLLAIADELREIKTICHCGRKATMVVRLGDDGLPVRTGAQIQIGGNKSYISMCRKHWKTALNEHDKR
jgi:thymidine kinase